MINDKLEIRGELKEIYENTINKNTVINIQQITELRKRILTENMPLRAQVSRGDQETVNPCAAQDSTKICLEILD